MGKMVNGRTAPLTIQGIGVGTANITITNSYNNEAVIITVNVSGSIANGGTSSVVANVAKLQKYIDLNGNISGILASTGYTIQRDGKTGAYDFTMSESNGNTLKMRVFLNTNSNAIVNYSYVVGNVYFFSYGDINVASYTSSSYPSFTVTSMSYNISSGTASTYTGDALRKAMSGWRYILLYNVALDLPDIGFTSY